MQLNTRPQREFIPDWNGNKALPENEQIVIYHKAVSSHLKERLIPKPSYKMTGVAGQDGESRWETDIFVDNTRLVKEMVEKIKNFSVFVDSPDSNSTTVHIKTADDLFGSLVPPEVSGLVEEIGQYLQKLFAAKAENSVKN